MYRCLISITFLTVDSFHEASLPSYRLPHFFHVIIITISHNTVSCNFLTGKNLLIQKKIYKTRKFILNTPTCISLIIHSYCACRRTIMAAYLLNEYFITILNEIFMNNYANIQLSCIFNFE